MKFKRYNRTILLWGYIICTLCLGYIWYRMVLIINSGFIASSSIKFSIRFIFGLLYYLLAYTYCIITNQRKLKQLLTKLYVLFEIVTITSGLCRLYMYDSPTILSIYRTFLKATVSPLAFIMAYVYNQLLLNVKAPKQRKLEIK